ncbi:glycosyltransferase family 39 protein [Candidatus Frankia nodulisporulans]|uniref:glycosyltransferase family 39 protein n=1 Tax=Candidatus Frankia nodulisporulans TaxID=2060052 RepID=UPI0021F08850|nr:glycosyltransferase family 39 protein [Candidatus Frankia nodulisporulans]
MADKLEPTAAARSATSGSLAGISPPGTHFRPWRILRSAPPVIWILTLLFTAMLASWSVLVPQYHAPDEPNHVDAVMRLVEGRGWPHPGHAKVTRGGVGAIMVSPYGIDDAPRELSAGPFTAEDAEPREYRPSWRTLERTPAPVGGIQQIVQHPPLYYWVNATVLKALPGDADDLRWDQIIGILRLVSVLMVAPLPLLAWAGAHRLADGNRIAGTCAALVPLTIPQLTHIGSSVNNDNLLVLTGGLATVAVAYVLRGDTSLRTAGYTGAFVGLALMTKSLAIVLVPMAALAYLVAWSRSRRDARAGAARVADDQRPVRLGLSTRPVGAAAAAPRVPWRPIALGGVIMVALGGWWWIVNVVRWGAFQPETPGFPLGQYLGDDWGAYTEVLVNGTILRWWGSIGWFEVNLSTIPVRVASALVVALFALALIRARSGRSRVDLLFMLWVTWGLFALMTLQSAKNFDRQYHVSGISGRYLYAGLAALAIGVGMGAAALGRHLSRVMPLFFLAGAATLQFLSVRQVFPHFWKPENGDLGDAWTDMAAWSPWPEWILICFAVAVCGLAVAAVVACGWLAVVGPTATAPDSTDPDAAVSARFTAFAPGAATPGATRSVDRGDPTGRTTADTRTTADARSDPDALTTADARTTLDAKVTAGARAGTGRAPGLQATTRRRAAEVLRGPTRDPRRTTTNEPNTDHQE